MEKQIHFSFNIILQAENLQYEYIILNINYIEYIFSKIYNKTLSNFVKLNKVQLKIIMNM